MIGLRAYYPPGTWPRPQHTCGHRNERQSSLAEHERDMCVLPFGHDGEHDYNANWIAHVEVHHRRGAVEIDLRSWHDTRAMMVRTRAEADALLAFLTENFDEAFGPEGPS